MILRGQRGLSLTSWVASAQGIYASVPFGSGRLAADFAVITLELYCRRLLKTNGRVRDFYFSFGNCEKDGILKLE